MSANDSQSRRAFVKTCLATATMVSTNPRLLAQQESVKHYQRARLLDQLGEPITSQSINTDQAYVFHYPYVTTPCFLIDIGRAVHNNEQLDIENGDRYKWQGGIGKMQSVVAFSAICAHKLSYPTKSLSFLNYRPEKVRFVNLEEKVEERSQLIYCCSELSAYDPARGAQVIGGPARQPLAAIELEYDAEADNFYAIGTRGGELYDEFFERFAFRLALDHQIQDIRAAVGNTTTLYPHAVYSQYSVTC